jgi:deazaflavin-dependent oxidoreductase (nitroreductase family)
MYLQDGDDYVIVGSRGGSDAPPGWWLNLQAMPETTIEIKGSKRRVTARKATTEEKAAHWPRLTAGSRSSCSHPWPCNRAYRRFPLRDGQQDECSHVEKL